MTAPDLSKLLRVLAAPIAMIGALVMVAMWDARPAAAQEGFDRPGADYQRRLLSLPIRKTARSAVNVTGAARPGVFRGRPRAASAPCAH